MPDAAYISAYHCLAYVINKFVQFDHGKTIQIPDGISDPKHPLSSFLFLENRNEIDSHNSLESEYFSVAERMCLGEISPDLESKQIVFEPMVAIFDQIKQIETINNPRTCYRPLKPLSLSKESLYPTFEKSTVTQKEASKLIEEILNNIAYLSGDIRTDIENILASLRLKAHAIPTSIIGGSNDISLYDYSRITAGIASCLLDFSPQEIREINKQLPELLSDDSDSKSDLPALILLGGSFSGIQKFIYSIATKKAAKTLRGRSVYIQLLTEVITRYILNRLQLPYSNVIYTGGGAFYLLVPLSAKDKIIELQAEITKKLLKSHGIGFYLSLGYCEIPFSGFRKGNISTYWTKMHQFMAQKKNQMYAELGKDAYDLIFEPVAHGGNRDAFCSVCNEEKNKIQMLDTQEEGRVCSTCQSFADRLGTQLPHAAFIQLAEIKTQNLAAETFEEILALFGYSLELYDKNGRRMLSSIFTENIIRSTVWEIDDPEQTWKRPSFNNPVSFWRRYIANQIPAATFEDMLDALSGLKRLGVLRMDVDNLGSIFAGGFRLGAKDITNFVRIAALSFQISLFFEGYLKKICDEQEYIYTVYSGGDDLFLIGPWKIITSLALKIQQEFKAYTGYHSAFNISGGMSFIQGGYPVADAADDAAEAEEKAKSVEGKAAFTFLGESWKWSDYSDLQNMKNQLVSCIEFQKAPRSLLHMLQELDNLKFEEDKKEYGRWIWMGDYQLKRLVESSKNNPSLVKALEYIHENIKRDNYRNIHQWSKAARWAQLEVREQ